MFIQKREIYKASLLTTTTLGLFLIVPALATPPVIEDLEKHERVFNELKSKYFTEKNYVSVTCLFANHQVIQDLQKQLADSKMKKEGVVKFVDEVAHMQAALATKEAKEIADRILAIYKPFYPDPHKVGALEYRRKKIFAQSPLYRKLISRETSDVERKQCVDRIRVGGFEGDLSDFVKNPMSSVATRMMGILRVWQFLHKAYLKKNPEKIITNSGEKKKIIEDFIKNMEENPFDPHKEVTFLQAEPVLLPPPPPPANALSEREVKQRENAYKLVNDAKMADYEVSKTHALIQSTERGQVPIISRNQALRFALRNITINPDNAGELAKSLNIKIAEPIDLDAFADILKDGIEKNKAELVPLGDQLQKLRENIDKKRKNAANLKKDAMEACKEIASNYYDLLMAPPPPPPVSSAPVSSVGAGPSGSKTQKTLLPSTGNQERPALKFLMDIEAPPQLKSSTPTRKDQGSQGSALTGSKVLEMIENSRHPKKEENNDDESGDEWE